MNKEINPRFVITFYTGYTCKGMSAHNMLEFLQEIMDDDAPVGPYGLIAVGKSPQLKEYFEKHFPQVKNLKPFDRNTQPFEEWEQQSLDTMGKCVLPLGEFHLLPEDITA